MDDVNLAGNIKVFGSSVVLVQPDGVSVDLEVTRTAENPSDAFAEANAGSAGVLAFLRGTGVEDIQSSRLTLHQRTEWRERKNGERYKVLQYTASIGHKLNSADLDGLEALLSGAIAAGANELKSVQFITSRLGELRRDARRQAVEAARAKAELYAEAAGVALGHVHAIEDINPDDLSGAPRRNRESRSASASDDAIEAGAIEVTGRVQMWFNIVG